MLFKSYLFIAGFSAFFISASAQDKTPVKYGKISPNDFTPKLYSIDSNANAVVLADVGDIEIVGNTKGWFSFEFKHFRRVHILNKNGYDVADVRIPLYKDGNAEEKIDGLKAVTYNLENGKVTETKLDTKSAVFTDVIDKNRLVRKFTFPNIKEGSIIEYEYKVSSDFLFDLQPWAFQGDYPVLWSECTFSRPEFLGYVFLSQGYQPFFIKEHNDRAGQTRFKLSNNQGAGATDYFDVDANVTDYRWVMKDVPALKEEGFTSSLGNFIDQLKFQWTDIRYPLSPQNVTGNWTDIFKNLLKSDYFGADLNKNNGWLSDVEKPLISGVNDETEKAKRIYQYVRDNITCTSHSAWEMDQSLKNVLKTRNGTVAEVNLLLVAMMKYANINADPVLLSTRSHGYVNPVYPALERFNYVICLTHVGGHDVFLDASQSKLGFGKLTPNCYNGQGRIVTEDAIPIDLVADSLLEQKLTTVLLSPDDKGDLEGSFVQVPGYYESHDIREEIKEKGKDEYFKAIKKEYGQDIELSNPKIDSLDNLEKNVAVSYNFKMGQDKEDVVYINPTLSEGYKQNPFKSAERFYPVEMPYATDESYFFTMLVPDGYTIDELPKSMVLKFNEQGDAFFEYRISESGGTISFRSRIVIKRTLFQPDEYETLREFFNMIVKKQGEQIVLKKKK